MKTISLLLTIWISLVVTANASQGLQGNASSTSATRTLPASAPFNALGSWAIELEFENASFTNGQALIEITDFFRVRAYPSDDQLTIFNWQTGGTASSPISVGAFTHFTLRIERDAIAGLYRMTIAPVSGSTPTGSTTVAATTASQNMGGKTLSVLANIDPGGFDDALCNFLRWKTGTAGSYNWLFGAPPVQLTAAAFDLVDWEFEGNGNDSSGRGLNASINGAGVFATSTNVAPRFVAYEQSIKSTDPIPLNCDAFLVTGNAAISSYSWSFVSGPSTATPANASIASTTATAGSRGEYIHQCSVTDALSQTANGNVKTGSAVVDSNGWLQFENADVGFILGPQLYDASSNNPWPKQSFYSKYIGNITGDASPNAPPDVTLTGTVSVTNGSAAVTGSGTAFLREIKTVRPGENAYYIRDAGGTWRILTIASVTDDTHLTLTGNWTQSTTSGRAHSFDPDGLGQFASYRRYGVYYDEAQTMYLLFEKTQLTRFRDYARKIADAWWACDLVDYGTQAAIDANESPRESNAMGLILRAVDGKPEYFDWLYRYSYADTNTAQFRLYVSDGSGPNTGTDRSYYPSLYLGARETGYASRFVIALAKVLPNTYTLFQNGTVAASTGTATDGATKRANMRDAVLAGSTRYYLRLQKADGSWRWEDPAWSGQYAEQVWHSAFILGALADFLRLMDDDATYKSNNIAAYNSIRWAVILGAAHHFLHHYNQNPWSDPPAGLSPNKSRYTVYDLYESSAGNSPPSSPTISPLSLDQFRQNSATALHIYGPAYYYSGVAWYKTAGDEVFGSFWGAGNLAAAGLNDDGFGGQHTTCFSTPGCGTTDPRTSAADNRRSEDLNQALQIGARYPAWRLLTSVPGNQPPLARAGADKALSTGTASTTINCDGIDPEGTAVTQNMTVEFGSGLSIDTPTATSATLSGLGSLPANSTVAVRCTATDGAGNSSFDQQTIWLNNLSGLTNNPAVSISITGGNNQSISATSTTLSATISNVTVSSASTSIAQLSGGPATITAPVATGTSPSFDIGSLAAGSYVFRIFSRDNSINTAIMPTPNFVDVRLNVTAPIPVCKWHTVPACN